MALRLAGGLPPTPPAAQQLPPDAQQLPTDDQQSPEDPQGFKKLDQSVAVYRGPEQGPFSCGNCSYYGEDRSCTLVDGDIDPEGFCNLFSPMSQGEAEAPMGDEVPEEAPSEEEVPEEEGA